MPDTMSLPATVTTRPLTTDDARAVFELTQAAELHDTGQSMVELEDIRGDWARPSYHLGAQSVGFFEDGDLVAYSEVHRNRIESYVHPAHRRRGLGTTLFRWSLAKAKELGYERAGQTVPATNQDAIAIFTAHGSSLLFTSWILELPAGVTIDAAPLPAGHRLRGFDAKRDTYDVYRTFEEAFNEWPDRVPTTLEDWEAIALARADFEPWQVMTMVEVADGVEHVGAVSGEPCWSPPLPLPASTGRRSVGSTPTPGPAPSASTSTWGWAWWRRTSTTPSPWPELPQAERFGQAGSPLVALAVASGRQMSTT